MGSIKSLKYASESSDEALEKRPQESVIIESFEEEYEEYLQLKAYYDENEAAHRRLIRKLDMRLLPILSLLYLLCSLDKANAANAKLFGFLHDVPMTSTQFNLALMYFFFTYGSCELPSNIMLRRLGPRIWFPFIICVWGVITACTCVIKNYGSFVAIRLALGCAEAGLYPGAYFVLSCWYLPHELQTRMGIFYGANTLAGAFGGVLAYGVGDLDYHLGWRAWRWLFLIEGCITVFFGLVTFFILPDFPYAFKQSWLGGDEVRYITLRAKYHTGRNPPDLKFKWSDVRASLKDWKTYTIMMMFWWGGSVPTYSLSYTLPTMVENLGYTAIKAQALTTPPYIFATIVTISVAYLSDKYKTRMKAIMFSYTMGLCGIIILMISVHYSNLYGLSYFAIFLAAAGYSAQAPGIGAWISNNVVSPTKRASTIGFMMAWGSIGGGSIGSNIYIASEAPTYPLGFGISIAATVIGAMLPCMINWYLLRRENLRRDTLDEKAIRTQYSPEELSDMGEDSPLFRYTL
ncbi:MFS general substrate transporter [Gymnopus androsaceus JB14]|uniref:MFS general substrate transporter n=1 Tax=Gymnopus androsaceus JB14 TaxID=1447944 RepID=A0A6A4I5N6_9AGAR|nr:MFS general substrate transporter [Gymnopus androsaceus JB14]